MATQSKLCGCAVASMVWMSACTEDGIQKTQENTGASTAGCTYDLAVSAGHCGCSVGSHLRPEDIEALRAAHPDLDIRMQIFPFGAHASSGHTEGHRGLDLIVTAGDASLVEVPVYAPMDGVISDTANAQDQSGGLEKEFHLEEPNVHFTKIKADCGIQVVFIPLQLDPGIGPGTKVAKGQRIGILPRTRNSESGRQFYSSHFETDARVKKDPAEYAVCPLDLFDSKLDSQWVEEVVQSANYVEKTARNVDITCDDGSVAHFNYPAESRGCNARLPDSLRGLLAKCQPKKAGMIW